MMVEGSWLTHPEFAALVRSGELTFEPYDPTQLRRLARYRIRAGRLLRPRLNASGGLERLDLVRDFTEDASPYVLARREYLVVEVLEAVILPGGLEGRLSPVSGLVDHGFGLTAGNLDAGYGTLAGERQRIHLGLTNLLEFPNAYDPRMGIAHIAIVDLRASPQTSITFTQEELQRFRRSNPRYPRDGDDGIAYPDEES